MSEYCYVLWIHNTYVGTLFRMTEYYYYMSQSIRVFFIYYKMDAMSCTLRKLVFDFLSNWMGYDRGDSLHFDFLNQMEYSIWFRKSKGILSPHDHIPFNLEGNGNIVLWVRGPSRGQGSGKTDDTLRIVVAILVNWHIFTAILTAEDSESYPRWSVLVSWKNVAIF